MISAEDARKETETKLNSKDDKILNELEHKIKNAINQGANSINGNGALSKSVENKLKQLGYEVKQGSQYNENYYSILW